MKIKKPRIRISTLSRAFVCRGFGESGSGWTMRHAYQEWRDNMIAKGKRSEIPFDTKTWR